MVPPGRISRIGRVTKLRPAPNARPFQPLGSRCIRPESEARAENVFVTHSSRDRIRVRTDYTAFPNALSTYPNRLQMMKTQLISINRRDEIRRFNSGKRQASCAATQLLQSVCHRTLQVVVEIVAPPRLSKETPEKPRLPEWQPACQRWGRRHVPAPRLIPSDSDCGSRP